MSEDYPDQSPESRSLLCPICYERFKNPVTLKCGHNLCEKCLKEMVRDAYCKRTVEEMSLPTDGKVCEKKPDCVKCPVCDEDHNEEINPNDVLRDLLSPPKEPPVCDECGKNVAVCSCLECGSCFGAQRAFFCEGCAIKFHDHPRRRDHTIRRPLCREDLSGNHIYFNGSVCDVQVSDGHQYPVCPTHKKRLFMYNSKNHQFFCEDCFAGVLPEEKVHCCSLSTIIAEARVDLERKMDETEKVIIEREEMKRRAGNLERLTADNEETREKLNGQVKKYISDFKRMLDAVQEKALGEINDTFDQYKLFLETLLDECVRIPVEYETLKKNHETSKGWNSFQTIMIYKQLVKLKERLDSVLKEISIAGTPVRLDASIEQLAFPKMESVLVFHHKTTKTRDEKPPAQPAAQQQAQQAQPKPAQANPPPAQQAQPKPAQQPAQTNPQPKPAPGG